MWEQKKKKKKNRCAHVPPLKISMVQFSLVASDKHLGSGLTQVRGETQQQQHQQLVEHQMIPLQAKKAQPSAR